MEGYDSYTSLFLSRGNYIQFLVLKVIINKVFGCIYEIVKAKNQPPFSHRLEQKPTLLKCWNIAGFAQSDTDK